MAVLLCDNRDDPLREQHYLRMLVARRVAGIIVTGRRTDPRPPSTSRCPWCTRSCCCSGGVVSDDAGVPGTLGGLIAHIAGRAQHHSAQVRAQAVATTAGDSLAHEPFFGAWSEQWGRQAVDLLLRDCPTLDAITCGQIARGACDRLRELGLTGLFTIEGVVGV